MTEHLAAKLAGGEMGTEKPKLPNMNEFSPAIVGDLKALLDVVTASQGNRGALRAAIAAAFEPIRSTPTEKQRLNRANNVLIGMSQCGLFDLGTNQLTSLGAELAAQAETSALHEMFANHILHHLHGFELLEVAETIRLRGDQVSLDSIRAELRARGFQVTTNEGNPSKLRGWMEKAGVVDSEWNADQERLQKVAGVTLSTVDAWGDFSRAQRALLLVVRELSTPGARWLVGSHIKKLCQQRWGQQVFPEGSLRAEVIDPLVRDGWVEAQGKGEGRGGKFGELKATPRLLAIETPLGIDYGKSSLPRDLIRKLSTPLKEIVKDLQLSGASGNYKKGLALELLSLNIVRDLGLRPIGFRIRPKQANYAELDLLANGVHLSYSRWHFQCKNTKMVQFDDLAREIGLAVVLKSHVIVLVTTGTIAKKVREHRQQVSESSHLQVVLLDGAALKRYIDDGAVALVDEVVRQAEDTLRMKAVQVLDLSPEEPSG